jgi:hypothetical protein
LRLVTADAAGAAWAVEISVAMKVTAAMNAGGDDGAIFDIIK